MATYLASSRRVIDLAAEIIEPLTLRAMRLDDGPRRRYIWSGGEGTFSNTFYRPWFKEEDPPIPGRWSSLRPEAVTAALKFVLGEIGWNDRLLGGPEIWIDQEGPGSYQHVTSRTLARRPGVVLLQTLIPRPNPSEEPGQGITAETARALKAPFVIDEPVRLYPGQSVIGSGHLSAGDPKLGSPRLIGRQAPYVTRPVVVVRQLDGEGVPALTLASGCRLEGLSIDSEVITTSPAIRVEAAEQVVLRDLSVGDNFRFQLSIGNGSRAVWAENFHCLTGVVVVEDETRDCTFWSSALAAHVRLGGTNQALWTGIIEPTLSPGEAATEVDVRGVGCSIFGNRIEGGTAESFERDQLVGFAGIRILEGADFTDITTGHHSHESFPVLVERDTGAALVRTLPLNGDNQLQPLMELGLTNLLQDSLFTSLLAERPDTPWSTQSVADLEPERGRAQSRGMLIEAERGEVGLLAQTFKASPADGIETVADRTFAGGVWVRQTVHASAILELATGSRAVASNIASTVDTWEFLSVVLHSAEDDEEVHWRLRFKGVGVPVQVGEPMLVRGPLIPPFHPRPLREAGGVLRGPLLLQAGSGQVNLTSIAQRDEWVSRPHIVGTDADLIQLSIEPLGLDGVEHSPTVEWRRNGKALRRLKPATVKGRVLNGDGGYSLRGGDELLLVDLPKAKAGAAVLAQLIVRSPV